MNETQNTEGSWNQVFDRTIQDAGIIGKAWARYGLLAGKSALETSGMTLGKVAGMLDRLAAELDREDATEASDVQTVDGQDSQDGPTVDHHQR